MVIIDSDMIASFSLTKGRVLNLERMNSNEFLDIFVILYIFKIILSSLLVIKKPFKSINLNFKNYIKLTAQI